MLHIGSTKTILDASPTQLKNSIKAESSAQDEKAPISLLSSQTGWLFQCQPSVKQEILPDTWKLAVTKQDVHFSGQQYSENRRITRSMGKTSTPNVLDNSRPSQLPGSPLQPPNSLQPSISLSGHSSSFTLRWTPGTKYHRMAVSTIILEKLKKPLTKTEKEDGFVYVFWNQGNFGMEKIGYTTKTTALRLKEWRQQCLSNATECVTKDASSQIRIRNARRVEGLVHGELKDYRHWEVGCKCGKKHHEWFKIDLNHVQKVVDKWTNWIREKPRYDARDGTLLVESLTPSEIEQLCTPLAIEAKALLPPKLRERRPSARFLRKKDAPRSSERHPWSSEILKAQSESILESMEEEEVTIKVEEETVTITVEEDEAVIQVEQEEVGIKLEMKDSTAFVQQTTNDNSSLLPRQTAIITIGAEQAAVVKESSITGEEVTIIEEATEDNGVLDDQGVKEIATAWNTSTTECEAKQGANICEHAALDQHDHIAEQKALSTPVTGEVTYVEESMEEVTRIEESIRALEQQLDGLLLNLKRTATPQSKQALERPLSEDAIDEARRASDVWGRLATIPSTPTLFPGKAAEIPRASGLVTSVSVQEVAADA